MPSLIVPDTIYLLTSANPDDVILMEDQTRPGQTAILFFFEREMVKKFRGGEYTKEAYSLVEMSVDEAEEVINRAKKEGIEALVLFHDSTADEGCRMALLTQLGGRVEFAQA